MFGLGVPELVVILIIILVIFGPKKIPEIGKSLGGALRELRKSTSEDSTDKEKSDTKKTEDIS